jgi:hypothetical protein
MKNFRICMILQLPRLFAQNDMVGGFFILLEIAGMLPSSDLRMS